MRSPFAKPCKVEKFLGCLPNFLDSQKILVLPKAECYVKIPASGINMFFRALGFRHPKLVKK